MYARLTATLTALLLSAGCQPQDQTPGLWLRGDERAYPADWAFTNAHREIALEVGTPYLVPHSITIWCAEVDGELYVAAARPDEKNWPGWVDDDPDVRIKVGDELFEARLEPLADAQRILEVRNVQARKYDLAAPSGPTTSRYWRVTERPSA